MIFNRAFSILCFFSKSWLIFFGNIMVIYKIIQLIKIADILKP